MRLIGRRLSLSELMPIPLIPPGTGTAFDKLALLSPSSLTSAQVTIDNASPFASTAADLIWIDGRTGAGGTERWPYRRFESYPIQSGRPELTPRPPCFSRTQYLKALIKAKEYPLSIKTVRRSQYSDEYEGREGLLKLPYKLLFQQSELRNGQLQSEIDELQDKVDALQARITELETENADLQKGLLKHFNKEVKREELYRSIKGMLEASRETCRTLRNTNTQLLCRLAQLRKD